MTGRRLRIASLVVASALVAPACGADGGAAADTAGVQAAEGYPPTDLDLLAADLAPLLEAHGVVLTRGPLIDRSDGAYDESPTGTHLALYVQPPDDYTAEQYIAGMRDLSVDAADAVFSLWPALDSFDICQEPPQSEDDRDTPAPYTTIDMTRGAWEELPGDVDLVGLLARSLDPLSGISLGATAALEEHPKLASAKDEALIRLGRGDPDQVST